MRLFRAVLGTGIAAMITLTALCLLAMQALATRAGEIAFESNRTGNWDIYLLDIQNGYTFNLTHYPADDLTPSWSPDGSKLGFVSTRDADRKSQAFIINANGTNLRRVTQTIDQYRDPTWTADGQTLVLTHGWRQIMLVDTLNSTERWIGSGFAPGLSPDGQLLLYYDPVTSGSNSHIYTLDLVTHLITDLTPGQSHNWDAAWSPDGSQIAFASLRGGRSAIYVMNRDGSDLHAITPGENDAGPAWSPDGSRIVYTSGASGHLALYIVSTDGSDRHRITSGSADSRDPAWRP